MSRPVELLKQLISIPSFSGDEGNTARLLQEFIHGMYGVQTERIGNNVVAKSPGYNPAKPTLLLCSHHDTVKPASGYTRDPFAPVTEKDEAGRTRLYGLGSNDAGAAVVSMLETFGHFCDKALSFNILLVLAAEEEISGANGILKVLPHFPEITCAIVGEPTGMQAACGERGLLVLDGYTRGVSGHAARNTGVNALYLALDDITVLRNYCFDKISPVLGPVHLQVTQIESGTQHNVIPDTCHYVTDIRTTDAYTNSQIVDLLQQAVGGTLIPRNLKNKASATPQGCPLVLAAEKLGIGTFISPTTSDWMRLECPAIKMGPGSSPRSHSADEFVYIDEVEEGIQLYIKMITAYGNTLE